jgi:hypothetical protein
VRVRFMDVSLRRYHTGASHGNAYARPAFPINSSRANLLVVVLFFDSYRGGL